MILATYCYLLSSMMLSGHCVYKQGVTSLPLWVSQLWIKKEWGQLDIFPDWGQCSELSSVLWHCWWVIGLASA